MATSALNFFRERGPWWPETFVEWASALIALAFVKQVATGRVINEREFAWPLATQHFVICAVIGTLAWLEGLRSLKSRPKRAQRTEQTAPMLPISMLKLVARYFNAPDCHCVKQTCRVWDRAADTHACLYAAIRLKADKTCYFLLEREHLLECAPSIKRERCSVLPLRIDAVPVQERGPLFDWLLQAHDNRVAARRVFTVRFRHLARCSYFPVSTTVLCESLLPSQVASAVATLSSFLLFDDIAQDVHKDLCGPLLRGLQRFKRRVDDVAQFIDVWNT